MAKKEKKHDKGTKSAAAVVATLQRQQANALVAYLNYKKYHWLSYGPLFRDIHLMLDEQATLVYDTIDEFAERAIMIGGAPLADPADYLPTASVRPSKGRLSLEEMIAEARAHARPRDRRDAWRHRGRDKGRRHRHGRPLHAPRPGAPEEPLVPERGPPEEGRPHELRVSANISRRCPWRPSSPRTSRSCVPASWGRGPNGRRSASRTATSARACHANRLAGVSGAVCRSCDSLEAPALLHGVVDIYMPDMKYGDERPPGGTRTPPTTPV